VRTDDKINENWHYMKLFNKIAGIIRATRGPDGAFYLAMTDLQIFSTESGLP
jgi:hypothetical protein